MNDPKLIDKAKQYVMNTYSRIPICIASGDGSYVTDTDGKRYLDMVAGIAVNNLGYGHPAVLQAIQEQAAQLIHISNFYWNIPQVMLSEKLCVASGLDKAFYCNSGAEANEAAIKLARKWGGEGRKHIITLEQSFHGRTMGALTATGQPKYQQAFTPLPEGFSYVPANDTAALQAAIRPDTCAIFVEIIQGEGGVNPLTEAYLNDIQSLCQEHNLLFMLDEVQTGIGRTGRYFAFQEYDLKPDVITLAKAVASGVPMGVMLAQDRAADAFVPGDHASTFGGNPLAAQVACAVADVIFAEDFAQAVRDKGDYMKAGIQVLADKYPGTIEDIRGRGLMIGVQYSTPIQPIVDKCRALGMLVCGAGANVLRFVPPLTISTSELDEALAILEKAMQA